MTAADCSAAIELTHSFWVPVIFLVKWSFCICGVILATCFTIKQGFSWLGHPNARVLYKFHIFWVIFLPSIYIISYGFDGFRLIIYHNEPCNLLVSTKIAIPMKAIPVVATSAQTLTMFAFSIERAFATLRPCYYETVKKPIFGIFLGVISVAIAFCLVLSVVLPVDYSKEVPLSTLRTAENGQQHVLFLRIVTAIEFCTFTIFLVTLFINRRRRKKPNDISCYKRNLGTKYQIKENLHLLNTLLPSFCVHFVFMTLNFSGIQFYYMVTFEKWWRYKQFQIFEYNVVTFASFAEILLQAHMYSLVLPAVVQLRLRIRRSRQVVDVNDTAIHFKHLRTMFN